MPLSLAASGDFLPQSPFLEAAADALGLLAAADVALINLEGPLTDATAGADTIARVRGAGYLARHLADAHVTVASLANNHAADFGIGGLLDTIERLRQAGIAPIGAGADLEQALQATCVERNGISLAALALATTLPAGCAAGAGRPGIAPIHVLSRFVIDPVVIEQNPGMAPYVETVALESDVEAAANAVAAAKGRADIVTVSIHWGVPAGWAPSYQPELADYQRPLAYRLIDAGADAVVGHHSHVVHPIEFYRDRPIFYGLGNFLFHTLLSGELAATRTYPPYEFASLRTRIGAVARLRWAAPGPPERIELTFVELDNSGNPHPAAAGAAADAAVALAAASAPFGVRVAAADDQWFCVTPSA